MASVPNTAHVHVKNGTCLALLIPCHLHLHLIVAHGQDVANTRGRLAFYSLFSPSVCSRVTKVNFSVTHVRNDSDTECERGANLLRIFFVVIGGRRVWWVIVSWVFCVRKYILILIKLHVDIIDIAEIVIE